MGRALALVFALLIALGVVAIWLGSRRAAYEGFAATGGPLTSSPAPVQELTSPAKTRPAPRAREEVARSDSASAVPANVSARGPATSRHRLSGRVVRDGGTPVARAEVILESESPFRSTLAPLATARTGADGTFELTCLGTGPFRVAAFERELGRITGQGEVEGVLAGSIGIEIHLPSCVVQGFVVDDLGRPVTNFDVGWMPLGAGAPMDGWIKTRPVHSDTGGFSETLTPGAWRCNVTPSRGLVAASREIVVPAPEPIALVVAREGIVRGVVVDPTGKPVPGAIVLADFGTGKCRSRKDGRFEMSLAPDVPVSLVAQAEGFAPGAPREAVLESGEERNDVVLRLELLAHLTVEVVGPDGLPVAAREVSTFRQDGPMYSEVAGSPCLTDSSGRFELDVPPGRLQVRIELDDDELSVPGRDAVNSPRACVRAVTLAPGERGYLHLALSGSPVRLHGRIELGGKSPVTARMDVRDLGGGRPQTLLLTDDRYDVLLPEPGVYLLVFSVDELSFQQYVDVPEVAEWRHDVSFRLGRISGHISDEAGSPLEGVTVDAGNFEGAPFRSYGRATTDREGVYSMQVVAANYRIIPRQDFEERRSLREPEPQFASVEPDTERGGVDFVLHTIGALEGIVRRMDGGLFTGARVSIMDSTGALRDESSRAGRFHVPLEGGRYWVSAIGGSETATFVTEDPIEVELRSGAVQTLELRLVPCTVVRVRLVDSGGFALANPHFARVEAIDSRGRAIPSHTDDSGGHTLPLLSGRYVLRVMRDRLFELALDVPEGQNELALDFTLE